MSRFGCGRLVALVVLVGCGDGVADGSYPGEVLFAMSGVVYLEADEGLPLSSLGVSILWAGQDEGLFSSTLLAETTFPARYSVQLFGPPPAEALNLDSGVSSSVGAPVLFEDVDEDGLPGADEGLVGGTVDVIVLWADGDLEPPDGAPEDAPSTTAGFHALRFSGPCFSPGDSATEVPEDAVDLYVTGEASAAPLEGCSE